MEDVQYQTIMDYKRLRESQYAKVPREDEGMKPSAAAGPSCNEYLYFKKSFDPDQKDIATFMNIMWRPVHPEYGRNAFYLGEVCINDEEFPYSAHAFVSADTETNQYTAFFDVEKLRPFLITYQSTKVMVRPEDWIPRDPSSFQKSEFTLKECINEKTGEDGGLKVSNYPYDTPMIFLAHFGLLAS